MTAMLLVLDFDGVLFNDMRFKRDYERLFARHGVPRRIHQAAYAESRALHHGGYRHDLHIMLIQKHVPTLQLSRIERGIEELLAHAGEYFYADTLPFLRYWQSKKERMALLSRGNKFQKIKVRASGVARFCKPATVADTVDKVSPLRRIIKAAAARQIVFIDDTKHMVDAIKQNFPHVLVIQMVRRKEQERSTHADAIVPNLAAARRFIESRAVRRAPNVRGY
ncbi:MAG: hypothetical protein WAP52_00020 [Candidatus Sungiibacteriota bacterium]